MTPRSLIALAIFVALAVSPAGSSPAAGLGAFSLRAAGLEESSPEVRKQFLKALQAKSGLEKRNEGGLTAGLEAASEEESTSEDPFGRFNRRKLLELTAQAMAAAGFSTVQKGVGVLEGLIGYRAVVPEGTLLERLVLLEDVSDKSGARFVGDIAKGFFRHRAAAGKLKEAFGEGDYSQVRRWLDLTIAPMRWFEHCLGGRLTEEGILPVAETTEANAWQEIKDSSSDWQRFQKAYVPDPATVAMYKAWDRLKQGSLVSEQALWENAQRAFVRQRVRATVDVSRTEAIAEEELDKAVWLLRILMDLPEGDQQVFQSALERDDMQKVSEKAIPALKQERQALLRELRDQFSYENRLRDERWQFTEREILLNQMKEVDRLIRGLAPQVPPPTESAGLEQAGGMSWHGQMTQIRGELRDTAESAVQRMTNRETFIALAQPGHPPGTDGFVDDWVLVEEARNRLGLAIQAYRLELEREENPLLLARGIAWEAARQGDEGNLGIAVGVISKDQLLELDGLGRVLEEIHLAHPALRVSVLFTLKEAMDEAQQEGRRPMPSFAQVLSFWLDESVSTVGEDPKAGLLHFMPKIVLPAELWWEFERSLRAQAGLEQAA